MMPVDAILWMSSAIMNVLNSQCLSEENRQSQQELAEKSQELQRQLEENRQNFQRENFKKTEKLQKEITRLNHNLRLKEQRISFENQKDSIEYKHFMDNWPLKVQPFILREEAILDGNKRVGLRVVMSKSANADSRIFNKFYDAVEHGIYRFLNANYSLDSGSPVLFYSGGWKENLGGGVALNSMLHYALKNLPTLILSPKVINDKLYLDVSMWGLGVATYYQDTLFEIPFEKKLINNTIDENHYLQYINDIQNYFNYAIGWVSDILNLIEYNQIPALPKIIMDSKCESEHQHILKAYYQQRYQELYEYTLGNKEVVIDNARNYLSSLKPYDIPDLSISYLNDTYEFLDNSKEHRISCLAYSMGKWLEIRGIKPYASREDVLLSDVINNIDKDDTHYLSMLKKTYMILKDDGYSSAYKSINRINSALAWNE